MEREGDKSNHFLKRIWKTIQLVAGFVLAIGMGVFLYDHVEKKLFVPVFVVLPLLLLIILNLVSIKVNLPVLIKSFGFCGIVFLVILFIRKSLSYYHLVGRNLPWIIGVAGLLIVFLLFFIILLKPVSTSIRASLAAGFLLGLFIPALFWNINIMFDSSKPVTYKVQVKRIISDYGFLGGRVELVKVPMEQMDKIIYLNTDVSHYVKGDEIKVIYHPGVFDVGWCEFE